MRPTIVDIETSGLDPASTIHCVVARQDGQTHVFRPREIEAAIQFLNRCDLLVGHNVIGFDIPVLERHGMRRPLHVLDTLVMSRAIYPGRTLWDRDQRLARRRRMELPIRPGSHALGAWGWRLENAKAEYTGGFEAFSQEMLDYCIQDVSLTEHLFEFLSERIPAEAAFTECRAARVCREIELTGVAFDVGQAVNLVGTLTARQGEIKGQLQRAFPDWYVPRGTVIPKRTQQSRKARPGTPGYRNVAKGAPYTEVKLTQFNPDSGDHIVSRLGAKYGWRPRAFTEKGRAQVTDAILADLRYPEAPLLAEYARNGKILGFISEGDNAWLKLETKGRLHGRIMPTGTVTGRASHARPNLGQVPARSEQGRLCRSMFVAPEGYVLVGCDASGLQLRVLAHYLAKYDGGAFAQAVVDGDPHSYMMAGTGIRNRDNQKTWTYAKLFGAGTRKLGSVIAKDRAEQGETVRLSAHARLGRESNEALAAYMTGLEELERALRKTAARGWLRTLDGRRIPVLSDHRALNTLLMAGEAVIAKRALVRAAEWVRPHQGKLVLWVHDEFQAEVPKGEYRAQMAGDAMVRAWREAGESLDLRVPIGADWKAGPTWADTH